MSASSPPREETFPNLSEEQRGRIAAFAGERRFADWELLWEQRATWPLARPPLLFETSRPGVFAVGHVRASSVKRVAAAVGEGSVCVQLLHRVLAE